MDSDLDVGHQQAVNAQQSALELLQNALSASNVGQGLNFVDYQNGILAMVYFTFYFNKLINYMKYI